LYYSISSLIDSITLLFLTPVEEIPYAKNIDTIISIAYTKIGTTGKTDINSDHVIKVTLNINQQITNTIGMLTIIGVNAKNKPSIVSDGTHTVT